MKAAKSALLLAIPALVVGCGGGSGGSGSGNGPSPIPAKYTIEFIAFSNIDATSIGQCAIYGQDSLNNPTKYTVASKATGQNMSVVIHDDKGQPTANYDSSDWSNGALSFNQSLVPANGYISIYYEIKGSSVNSFDVLTIEKEMLPSKITVNAKGESVFNPTNTCIRDSVSKTSEFTASINDGGIGAGFFAFSSSSDFQVASSANNISFTSYTNKDILALRYEWSASPMEYEPLIAYALTSANANTLSTPVSLTSIDNSAQTTPWSVDSLSTTTTFSSAELSIYLPSSGALHWQNLPPTSDGAYSYAESFTDNYYITVSGQHKSWDFTYSKLVSSPEVGINESSTLDDLSLPAPQTTNHLVSCSTSEVGSCIAGYSSELPDSFKSQRTLVSLINGSDSIHQTIYASAKSIQPLMKFDNSLDDIWSNSLAKTEITVLSNTDNDVEKMFLSNYLDAYLVTEGSISSNSYIDSISIVEQMRVKENHTNTLKHSDYTLLQYNL